MQHQQVKWLLDRNEVMPAWMLARCYWDAEEDRGAFIRSEAPHRIVEISQYLQANPDRQRYMWGFSGDVPSGE